MEGSTRRTQPSAAAGLESLGSLDSIGVLHVDDESDFAELTATLLEREDPAFDVRTEPGADAALECLDRDGDAVDCVLSDYRMPGRDGLELAAAVHERAPDLPFILYTGTNRDAVAGPALDAGVTDVVGKGGGTVQYALLAKRIRDAVETHSLERSCERLVDAAESVREGVGLLDDDGRFTYVNPAYAAAFGYDRASLLGRRWEALYPDAAVERVREDLIPRIPEEGVLRTETRMVRADGSTVVADHAVSSTAGGVVCTVSLTQEAVN